MVFSASRYFVPGFFAWVLVASLATPLHAGGEIYGTLFLESGRHYTGEIRWDLNEVFWDDVLDAEKHEQVWVEGGSGGVQVFGLSIGDDDGYWTHHPFKIQFGHLAAIEPRGGDHVRVELKNGKVIDVRPTGTDLSESMRSLTVTDRLQGDVDVTWDEIDRVEFTGGPGEGRDSDRLYGVVRTTAGDFTGFIIWDKDEALTTDVLDGEDDEDGHKIPFGDIHEIARASSSASRVTLADGSKLRLTGTNDVSDENRGIDVWVPEMGVVKIPWDEFDRVVFEPAPPSSAYGDFDGGTRLHGTLTDDDGKTYTGTITWDLDEQYTWEFLDGQQDDLEYEIPFDRIQKITHDSRHGARVQLKNGETLVLSASNDVDTDNKGIVVEMADGDEMEFDWYDFTSLEFTQP